MDFGCPKLEQLLSQRRWNDAAEFIKSYPYHLPRFLYNNQHSHGQHIFAYIYDLEEDDADFLVDLLLSKGVKMNEADGEFAPLQDAYKFYTVKKLLEKGADPNFDDHGHICTPLYAYAYKTRYEWMEFRPLRLLLQYGANPYFASSEDSAMDIARRLDDVALISYYQTVYVTILLCAVHQFPHIGEHSAYRMILHKDMTRLLFEYLCPILS
jgi:hypothetical protein